MARGASRLTMLWRNERGIALPLALMALVILTSMALALLSVGRSEVQVASNLTSTTQAQYLADAGLEDAFNALRTTPANVSAAPTNWTTVPGLSGPGSTLSAVGSYSVKYKQAGLNTVLVMSTGTTTTNAQRPLRALLTINYVPNQAVLTGGDLDIQGKPNIQGTCGNVHSNGNLEIMDKAQISGDATASGTYTNTQKTAQIGGMAAGGTATQAIPNIDPTQFLAAAKYGLNASQIVQMNSNGTVSDGNGALLASLANGQTYSGWQYSSGSPATWTYNDQTSGKTAYQGFFYVNGNAVVAGKAGSDPSPWYATIVSTGTLQVSGSPNLAPILPDTLLVSGSDMTISGKPDLTTGFNGVLAGLIASHEQISITGKPEISGAIVAQAATSTNKLVLEDTIDNSVEITYNCGLNAPYQGTLRSLSWGF